LFTLLSNEVLKLQQNKITQAYCDIIVPVLLEEILSEKEIKEKNLTVSDKFGLEGSFKKLLEFKYFPSIQNLESLLKIFEEESFCHEVMSNPKEKDSSHSLLKDNFQENEKVPFLVSDEIQQANHAESDVCFVNRSLREYIYAIKLFDFFIRLHILMK